MGGKTVNQLIDIEPEHYMCYFPSPNWLGKFLAILELTLLWLYS